MDKKKIYEGYRILGKVLLLVFGIWGLCLTFNAGGFMGNGKALLYFTIQSNITIMLIIFVFLIIDIYEMITKKKLMNNVLKLIKFVFTVAITITFTVFFIILAPTMPTSYLLSMGNLTVHFFVPVLAIVDLFLYDHNTKFNKNSQLFGIAMPLYYLIFAFILSFSGVTFGEGEVVPYYFMNYEKFGWFSFSNGLGVVYWIIILVIAVIGLIYLYNYLLGKVDKKCNKKIIEE